MIIGLTGPARTGKDTAADILVKEHGFYRIAFADPIRRFVGDLTYLSNAALMDGAVKESELDWLPGFSPRRLMQLMGTEFGRELVHPDLWVKRLEQEINEVSTSFVKHFVIPDVRFDNEADFVRRRGGYVVHITRQDAPTVSSHSSENGVTVKTEDFHIQNDSTVERLSSALEVVVSAIEEIKEKQQLGK